MCLAYGHGITLFFLAREYLLTHNWRTYLKSSLKNNLVPIKAFVARLG